MSTDQAQVMALESLLEYIREHRGFDFTGYKRASLERRINKRMHTVGLHNYQDYLDHLQVQPEEFTELFNTILINVTRFFRDREAWSYLAEHVLPEILAGREPHEPVRVWNPGCSSGQESCTVAILLAETLGVEACRERVKIYGTDVDEDALNSARHASYSAAEIEHVPEEYREKYFDLSEDRYIFIKELRRCIIYGRHDLVQDAPISRVDVLVCRNTMMYFNSETQYRTLSKFHFALKDEGALFLGKGETLLTRSALFTPIQLKQRLFRKVPNRKLNLRVHGNGATDHDRYAPEASAWLRDAAFESCSTIQLVLDADRNLALANKAARTQFGIREQDLGRPFQDFEISYDPTDLRSMVNDVLNQRRPVTLDDVRWTGPTGDVRYLKIEATPLFGDDGTIAGTHISVFDVSLQKALGHELDRAHQDLETAHEELEATLEEVETTNEELQSTNEELETMNEELQSTNEELETMNEELQSTNEELESINNELRNRTTELDDVNTYLESILSSLRIGVVVIDAESQIQIWNDYSTDLWGLGADEVTGRHFLNLDIGLQVDELRGLIRDCLSGESVSGQVTVRATNRTGKFIDCTITCVPLTRYGSSILGAIMLMETSAATQA